jgi:hypothetical protein
MSWECCVWRQTSDCPSSFRSTEYVHWHVHAIIWYPVYHKVSSLRVSCLLLYMRKRAHTRTHKEHHMSISPEHSQWQHSECNVQSQEKHIMVNLVTASCWNMTMLIPMWPTMPYNGRCSKRPSYSLNILLYDINILDCYRKPSKAICSC